MATVAAQPVGTIFGRRLTPVPAKAPAQPLSVLDFGPVGATDEAPPMLKVRFNRPVVPLGHEGMRDAGDLLALTPLVPGRAVWRGADLLVFEPAHGFPLATRFEVKVDAKLTASDAFDWNALVARPDAYWQAVAWWEVTNHPYGVYRDDPRRSLRLDDLGGRSFSQPLDLADDPRAWSGRPLDLEKLSGPGVGLVAVAVAGKTVEAARGLYQVADLGLAGWIGAGRSALQAIRLSTGEAVSGVEIRARAKEQPLFDLGKTDASGLLTVTHWPGKQAPEEELLFLAKREREQGLLPISQLDYATSLEPGSDAGEALVGDLVAERVLYLPGETVHFVGWAAIGTMANADGLRQLPAGTTATVTLTREKHVLAAQKLSLDARGKLWGHLVIPKSARLGWYTGSSAVEAPARCRRASPWWVLEQHAGECLRAARQRRARPVGPWHR